MRPSCNLDATECSFWFPSGRFHLLHLPVCLSLRHRPFPRPVFSLAIVSLQQRVTSLSFVPPGGKTAAAILGSIVTVFGAFTI